MFAIPKNTIEILDEYRLTAEFKSMSQTVRDEQGKPLGTIDINKSSLCRLYDRMGGKYVIDAYGPDDRTALANAMAMIRPEHKGKSQAEMIARVNELEAEVARLKGGGEVAQPAPDPDAGNDPAPTPTADPYADLTGKELRNAMTAEGIEPHEGDIRSAEWQAEARRRLTEGN